MISSNLLLALCAPALAWATPFSKCKAFPGSRDWPSRHEWSRLNKTIDGRLIVPELPGGVCHKGQPNYSPDQCPKVREDWRTFEFHSRDPVSVMWDLWANYTCLPYEEASCSGAGYPSYVANVTTAKHVKAAVDFARKENVRLIVRSSGHDYLGRSVGSGSLSIWTHHLNKLTFHKRQFKLSGSRKTIPGDAITVGAGAMMFDLYKFAKKHDRIVVGGGGKTVGLGGYISGGGHSILAPHYGLGADNVLEMEVVTPNGKIITVNEDRRPDLFWALCGGGGSTFGVLTSITIKTHPVKKLTMVSFMAFTAPEVPFVLNFTTWAASQIPYLSDSGLSGYLQVTVDSPQPQPIPGLPKRVAGLFGKSIFLDQDEAKINKIFKPINETMQKYWPGQVHLLILNKKYDSFFDWYLENYDMDQAGGSVYLVSRLLGKAELSKDVGALQEALKPVLLNEGWLGAYAVAGKGVHNAKPRGGGNAVHPSWRKAYILAIHWLGWVSSPLDKTADAKTRKIVDQRFEGFRKLSPKAGSYTNEGYAFERDWQHVFWGDNYERLAKIKRKVDPKDVLWCTPCVGGEGWEEKSDGRLCRVG